MSVEPIPVAADRPRLSPRIVRRVVLVVFVAGIGGMIGGSIADNNGIALTFGLVTAAAALALVLITSVSPAGALDGSLDAERAEADERLASDVEARIDALVDAGADETAVRRLVGRAVELGRSRR